MVSDSEIIIRPKVVTSEMREDWTKNASKIKNVYEMFTYSVEKFANQKCLGMRPILNETKIKRNGKMEEKVTLGDKYVWQTYKDVGERIINVSTGISQIPSLKPKEHIIIYADTCIEWFVTAMACFKNNYTIVTMYTNLGNDGIRY